MNKAVKQSRLNKARDDKFLLVFDLPLALRGNKSPIKVGDNEYTPMDSVQFAIAGSVVPQITVPAIESRFSGNTMYVSSHSKKGYPPVSIKFNIDNEYKNYWVIYQWINFLHDEYAGHYNVQDVGDDDLINYKTDLTIYGLDDYNKKIVSFTYKDAFPTEIKEVTYDYTKGSEISSGFTFVYSQMHTKLL